MSETLHLTPRETLTIVRSDPEVLEVKATWAPAGKPPPAHLHPAQAERFEVLEGTLNVKLGDAERTLSYGDTLDIPAGTPHQMWNGSNEEARARWETRPAGRTLQWFRVIDREVAAAGGKMPSPLVMAPLLEEYADVFRLAVGPEWVVGGR